MGGSGLNWWGRWGNCAACDWIMLRTSHALVIDSDWRVMSLWGGKTKKSFKIKNKKNKKYFFEIRLCFDPRLWRVKSLFCEKVDAAYSLNWSATQLQQPATDRCASSRLIVKLLITGAGEKTASSAFIYNWYYTIRAFSSCILREANNTETYGGFRTVCEMCTTSAPTPVAHSCEH